MKVFIDKVTKNPIGKTFLGLIFATIFGISALIFSILYSSHLGSIYTPYQIKDTYRFDDWTINYDFLTLEYPEGGYVIPGYQNNLISCVLIIGEADVTFYRSDNVHIDSNSNFPISDKVTEVIIPLYHEDFDSLKKDVIFVYEEINYPTDYILERLESSQQLLHHSNILGVQKILPPTPNSTFLILNSNQFGDIVYREDKTVEFASDSINYSFNHPIGYSTYPLPYSDLVMFVYNLLLVLAFLGLTAFLTTDIDSSIEKNSYLEQKSAVLHIIGFTIFLYVAKVISVVFQLTFLIQLILIIIPIVYLIYCMYNSGVPLEYLGLRKQNILRCTLLALIIFYLCFITTTFQGFPVYSLDIKQLISAAVLIFFSQLLLRGFIQTTLESLLGNVWGLVFSSFLILVFPLLDKINNPSASSELVAFTGYFFIILVSSYGFQRTRNILFPSLLTLLFTLFL